MDLSLNLILRIRQQLDLACDLKYKLRMILNNEIKKNSENHTENNSENLGALHPGDFAEITGFQESKERESFLYRLFEIGFLVGETLEVLNHAPLSRCPISVKIKDATYAIRREDASLIRVRKFSKA